MKKQSPIFRALMVATLFFGLTAFVSGTANAEWSSIHGTSGHVQNESVVYNFGRYGWGLDFRQASGKDNWVHFAVPSEGNPKTARFIKLIGYLGSDIAEITDIHVWNGPWRVKTLKVNWKDPGWFFKTLDLGTPFSFESGLGISVRTYVSNDPDASYTNNRFIFSSVSADFK